LNNDNAAAKSNSENFPTSSEVPNKRTLEYWLSKVLSVILHPLLIPSYFSAWVLFHNNPEGRQKELAFYLLLILMVFTIVFPLVIIFGLQRLGLIKSIHMLERTDRVLPMFFMAIVYAACLYSLKSLLHFNALIYSMLLSMNICVVIAGFISLKTKISAHAIAITGVLGFLFASSFLTRDGSLLIPVEISLILCGALLSARLYLNAHTPLQLILGTLCGFLVSFTCTVLLLN